MTRWKTFVLATASFGLLSGVAIAQDQPDPQTNPPIEDKTAPDQNKVKPDDEVQKPSDSTKLPDDVDKTTTPKKEEGMGTDTGKGLGTEPAPKGELKGDDKGDVKGGDVKGGDIKGDDVKGAEPKTGGDIGAEKGAGQHGDKMQLQDAQQKLKDQGLYKGEVDGVMGPRTRAAIKQFQQSKGLSVSGQLDSATLNAMGISGQQGNQPGTNQ